MDGRTMEICRATRKVDSGWTEDGRRNLNAAAATFLPYTPSIHDIDDRKALERNITTLGASTSKTLDCVTQVPGLSQSEL